MARTLPGKKRLQKKDDVQEKQAAPKEPAAPKERQSKHSVWRHTKFEWRALTVHKDTGVAGLIEDPGCDLEIPPDSSGLATIESDEEPLTDEPLDCSIDYYPDTICRHEPDDAGRALVHQLVAAETSARKHQERYDERVAGAAEGVILYTPRLYSHAISLCLHACRC